MSTLWESVKQFFVHPNTPLYYGRIPDTAAPGSPASTVVNAGAGYFRMWLSQMYLKNDRTWFQDWYPMVHALVELQFGDTQLGVPYVIGPGALRDLDAAHLNKVIQLNQRLTGLLPYNGGTVAITAGLMAMKGGNQLLSVLKVISDVSALLAVPQLSAVVNIAEPVANGVQGLLTASNGGLQLGLRQTFVGGDPAGNELRSGYFVAIGETKDKVQPEQLIVKDGQLLWGPNVAAAKPYTGAAFMLFRLEVRAEHDNYEGLSSIEKRYKDAERALINKNEEEAKAQLRGATLEALQSADLTRADRTRLPLALKQRFEDAKKLADSLGAVDGVGLEERVRDVSSAVDALKAEPLDMQTMLR